MSSEVELIKSRILPSEIIAKKILLKNRGGVGYVGLCPFHREKTPSFFVNDDKRIYHCFGCGVHGDIFSFVMQDEGIPYKEALEKLADIAGVKLRTKNKKEIEKFEKDKIFFHIYKKVAELYQEQLFSDIGKNALNYVLSRGIKLEIIKQYNLGFSPKDHSIILSELKKEFSEDDLFDSGVINRKNDFTYDPFYGRLIFPIKNRAGECIGFGGRILGDGEPKYLNSAENPIFIKSEHLYGYNYAKNIIYKDGNVIVVEGYMDVIALVNCGIKNVVAPLGAGIKLSQIQILWETCQEPTICFDNDLAGKNAARKIAYESLKSISHNKSLKFVKLTNGKDPDEVIKNKGVEFFKDLVSQGIALSDYIFEIESNKYNLSTPEKKIALKVNLEKISESIANYSLKKSYLQHFKNKYYDLIYKFRKSLYAKLSVKNFELSSSQFSVISKENKLYQEGLFILSILWNYPDLLDDNKIIEDLIEADLCNELDNIRKMLLDFSLSDDNELLSFYNKSIANPTEKNDFSRTIEKLTKFTKFESQIEAKENLFRAFNIKKMRTIRDEIELLKNQLLLTVDDKLMKKMLYLKKYERQLKDEIANQ